MSAKSVRKREMAPRMGKVTPEEAEALIEKLQEMGGGLSAILMRMRQKKITVVDFDGGNTGNRALMDFAVFLAKLEYHVKNAEIRSRA